MAIEYVTILSTLNQSSSALTLKSISLDSRVLEFLYAVYCTDFYSMGCETLLLCSSSSLFYTVLMSQWKEKICGTQCLQALVY